MTVSVGVVGLGYWGPNLARNFDALPDSRLTWICDGDGGRLERVSASFPGARATGARSRSCSPIRSSTPW